MSIPTKERFMQHVEAVTESGCWLWTGSISCMGYGLWGGNHSRGERTRTAHRVAYELFKGPIPEDKVVMHSCDVRCCVNPAHLMLGTHKENSEQMVRKGRAATGTRNSTYTHPETQKRGEQHHRCKITDEIAFFIRYSGLSLPTMAKRYGLSIAQLQRIRVGKSWAHLPAFRGH